MTMSKPLSEQVATLETDLAEALAENRYLEAENDELRRGQGRWPKVGPAVAPTVPRLIAADELESGAKVATFTDPGRPVAGTVTGEAAGKVRLLLHNDNLMGFDTERTFVLLEDAPGPEKADDFPCCSDTPPRLTVHKLNVAPVGSYLSRGVDSDERRKWEDGLWQGAWMFEGQRAETSEELIAAGWADATLRLPEGQ